MSSHTFDGPTARGMTASPDDMPDDIPLGPNGAPIVRLPMEASQRDVRMGVNYLARVNNVEVYGVFVSLNDAYPDVSGLVHKSALPPLHMPVEFDAGDEVVVQAIDVNDKGLLFRITGRYEGDAFPPREDVAVAEGALDLDGVQTAGEFVEEHGLSDVRSTSVGDRRTADDAPEDDDHECVDSDETADDPAGDGAAMAIPYTDFASLAVLALEQFDPMDDLADVEDGPFAMGLATLALAHAKGLDASDVDLSTATNDDGVPVLTATFTVPLDELPTGGDD